MQRLILGQVESAASIGRALTMEPPGYVDIEDCKNEDDGAKDWRDDVLERWKPVWFIWGGCRGGKSGVCRGAVVGFDVGRGG